MAQDYGFKYAVFKKDLEKKHEIEIQKAQKDLINLQKANLSEKEENEKKTAYIESNKRLLMISLGVLSVAGLLVGLYLPLLKKQAFIFSVC